MSFDIPFDKEDSAPVAASSAHGMVRSISTDDGSGFKVNHMPRGMKRNLSFQPVNGQSIGIQEEGCPDSLAGIEPCRRAFPNGHGSVMASAPSMKEALQINHSPTKPPVEGINKGFFLHSQEAGDGAGGLAPVSDSDSKDPLSTTDTTEVDTGIHIHTEDMLDEDSSLKELSVNMDLDVETPSPCPSNQSKSPSGVKLTSFAEQKMRKLSPSAPDSGLGSSSSMKTTPEGSEFALPLSVSWAPTPEYSPVHQQTTPSNTGQATPSSAQLPPNDPAQVMATEMVQLRIRLEEKRKAIEAQKKKVEAAFTRHRQKMGHSAFLNVVKRKADGAVSGEERGQPDEEVKLASTSPTFKFGRSKADTPDGEEQSSKPSYWQKTQGTGEDGGQSHAPITEADLSEYTRSIEKLNHSLAFLQAEMQRLAQQQEVIMAMREQQHQQTWIIPPPHTNPSPQKHPRSGAVTRSSGPSSPADSPRSTHRSPTSIKRKSASFHSRNPRTARPSELKLAPYSRFLNAPQSVDSIPRLRRFSPCQPLMSSFLYMGEKPAINQDGDNTKETNSVLSPDRELASICAACSPHSSPNRQTKTEKSDIDANSPSEETGAQNHEEISDIVKDDQNSTVQKSFIELKPTIESSFPEVLAHPVVEIFTVTPTDIPSKTEPSSQAKSSLIEVPLSVKKPMEDLTIDDSLEMEQGSNESVDDEPKQCHGFFFKVISIYINVSNKMVRKASCTKQENINSSGNMFVKDSNIFPFTAC